MFFKMLQSFRNNKKGIVFILFSALCTSVGQALWKLSDQKSLLYLFFGFCLYALGALLMLIAFRHGALSVLHPLLSVGYLFGLFIGYFFLLEMVTYKELIGTLIILCGVIMIGGGDS
ncbi:EamA family transporter [Paenibacillus sp. MMS20-IR301]|uniref:EamA family transporter n=1 Tax=Paenibacillus sp. MMS20-IR301 TaxID=2895946 RepID=UPI0028F02ED0|nr:EamA family transporter [Paenibacillus sp. MMS20-IR301]WNS42740.1 EamA family transporter [Paenibacillus sp. MMS20-IR301]